MRRRCAALRVYNLAEGACGGSGDPQTGRGARAIATNLQTGVAAFRFLALVLPLGQQSCFTFPAPQASMPTRHGALAKNANTSLRLSFQATTTLPSASTPWIWNTFFARSTPMLVILDMNGLFGESSSTIIYGTSTPCEAPSTSSKVAASSCPLLRRRSH